MYFPSACSFSLLLSCLSAFLNFFWSSLCLLPHFFQTRRHFVTVEKVVLCPQAEYLSPFPVDSANSLETQEEDRTTSPGRLCGAPSAPGHCRRCGPHEWSTGRKAKPGTVRAAGTCSRSVSAGSGPCACALGAGARRARQAVAGERLLRVAAAAALAEPRARRAGTCGASRLAQGCRQPWRPPGTARGGRKEEADRGTRRNSRACPETTWPP